MGTLQYSSSSDIWNFRTREVSGKMFSGAIITEPVWATVCLRHDSNSKHFKYIRENYTMSQITKAKFLFPPFIFHVLSFVSFPDSIGLWAPRAGILILLSPFSPLPHEFSVIVVVVALLNTVPPPRHLMARSFIIVSSSSPLRLLYFNKPLHFKSLRV